MSVQVPVLETPSGTIFESNAIARYVARLRADTNLLGDNNFQQGQVDQWIDFATNELEAARNIWVYPLRGWLPANEKVSPITTLTHIYMTTETNMLVLYRSWQFMLVM